MRRLFFKAREREREKKHFIGWLTIRLESERFPPSRRECGLLLNLTASTRSIERRLVLTRLLYCCEWAGLFVRSRRSAVLISKQCHMLFLILSLYLFCVCFLLFFFQFVFFKKGKKKQICSGWFACAFLRANIYIHSHFQLGCLKHVPQTFPSRQYLAPCVCGVVLRFATKLTIKRSQKNNKLQQQIHAPGSKFWRPTMPDAHFATATCMDLMEEASKKRKYCEDFYCLKQKISEQ